MERYLERERVKWSAVVLIVLVFLLAWLFLGVRGYWTATNFPQEITGEWQAVFLDNNQTYFGKLEDINVDYVKLSNVYYLRSSELQQKGDSSSNLSLVKLGGELHGPENVMYIRKGTVQFWENLRTDSRVVQLIGTMR